jgi:hypothetical protein
LNKKLQKFLIDGTLPLAQALVLAKLPEEMQKDLMKSHSMEINGDELIAIDSLKELKKRIEDEHIIPLNSAVFDASDKKLDVKRGSCTDCGFNTGANKSLFEDITEESKCMKGSCFIGKTWKHIKNRIKQLEAPGEKPTFLYESNYVWGESKKIIEGFECWPSCEFEISKKKKEGFNLGIMLAPERFNPKLSLGEELFIKRNDRKKESHASKKTTILPDESPIEQRERRMKKRFEREDEIDKAEVRKEIAKIINQRGTLSRIIIEDAAKELLFGLKLNNLLVFRAYGIEIEGREKDETGNLDQWGVDDKIINKLLSMIKSEEELLKFIKCAVTYSYLDIFVKANVNITSAKNDKLIKLANEYEIDINALHKTFVEKRTKERETEIADLEAAKKRAKEREKKPSVEVTPKSKSKLKK